MKVLLTGAAGFIGSHVWNKLLSHGHEVTAVDSLDPQVHGTELACRKATERALYVHTCGEFVDGFIGPVDTVIHLAAAVGVAQSQYEPTYYVKNNCLETVRLWEWIATRKKTIRRVVVASSMSVYGEGTREGHGGVPVYGIMHRDIANGWDGIAVEEPYGSATRHRGLKPIPTPETHRCTPASIYAATKLDTELYSLILGRAHRLSTVALRFFNTYGPGQSLSNAYTGLLAQFAAAAQRSHTATIYEDGKQQRDFVYVEDVAEAVVLAAEKPEIRDGPYNVCTGKATSVSKVAEMWADIMQSRTGRRPPAPVYPGVMRDGDVRHCVGDPIALFRATGWRAKVGICDGLTKLYAWLPESVESATDCAHSELLQHGLLRGQG